MKPPAIFGSVVVAGLVLLQSVAACSSGTTTTIIVPAEAGPTTTSPDAGVSTLLPDGGASCVTTSDTDTCATCCGDQNPDAAKKYVEYILACFCQTTTDFCGTQCADTYCGKVPSDPPAGSACDQCLTAKNAACGERVDPQCENDPGCLPLAECLTDSDCSDKPQL